MVTYNTEIFLKINNVYVNTNFKADDTIMIGDDVMLVMAEGNSIPALPFLRAVAKNVIDKADWEEPLNRQHKRLIEKQKTRMLKNTKVALYDPIDKRYIEEASLWNLNIWMKNLMLNG